MHSGQITTVAGLNEDYKEDYQLLKELNAMWLERETEVSCRASDYMHFWDLKEAAAEYNWTTHDFFMCVCISIFPCAV